MRNLYLDVRVTGQLSGLLIAVNREGVMLNLSLSNGVGFPVPNEVGLPLIGSACA
jgi:hypothetical protein